MLRPAVVVFAFGLLAVLLVATPSHAQAPPAAVTAFDRYVQLTETRIAGEVSNPSRFLWIDTLPASQRPETLASLQRGEVVTERLETHDRGASIEVPGGSLLHWVGTVFVPGASVAKTVALLQDYDRHGEIYKPVITQAHVISHHGDDFTFTMRFVIKKVITAVLNTDQQAHFDRPQPDRAFSRIASVRIVEIENAGTPQEREKKPGDDHGYLWRLVSYWRFLERDGGTYVQCESVSLSRPLPTGLGWLLGRAAAGVPRDIITSNLAATRVALGK